MSAAPAAAIGVGRVAHATPDGYTLSIGHTQTHVFNAVDHQARLRRRDRLRAGLADRRHADLDHRRENRCRPTTSKASSPGSRSRTARRPWGRSASAARRNSPRRIFMKETGTSFQLVPYRGGAPLVQDMLGDHIDFAFGQAAGLPDLRRERSAQGLAVLAAQALVGGAQRADAGRARLPRYRRQLLARHLGAERHAAGRDRQAQCRRSRGLGRSDGAGAFQESRPGNLAGRVSNARSAGGKQKAEIAKWTPVIKESGIKAE